MVERKKQSGEGAKVGDKEGTQGTHGVEGVRKN